MAPKTDACSRALSSAVVAQIIRNGGGRVTADVLRSLLVTQDILQCNTIMVIHHNDCGAQVRAPRLRHRRLFGWQLCRAMSWREILSRY